MNCFYYLKDKARSRSRRSAPELRSSGSNSGGSQAIARSLGSGVLCRGINELYQEKSPSLRVFSYSELRQATRDFNRTHKIGEGGFGCVYKAHLVIPLQSDPLLVAIKKLNKESFQGHKQWLAEVQFLGVVEHPNLVKLIGYCAEDDDDSGIQRLLVYEYMTNRSLEDHLFKKRCAVLPWEMRLQIILGAAQGLAYLHEGLELQVIFRDFKTSNVLLDEHFQAKLSDFGLAREGPSPGRSHVSTAVIGTHGYAAPEYVETGHLTSKSDVWSFGVVLYEILTGRRSLERSRPRSEEELLEWVKQYSPDSKKFSFIMDPRLEKQYSLSAARKIAKLAETCIAKNPKDRPKMTRVVEQLKNIINDTPNDRSSESSMCDQSVESDHNQGNQNRTPESARRRQAQLEKLGDHVQGFSRRKFLIIQKAQPREQQISRKQYLLKGKS